MKNNIILIFLAFSLLFNVFIADGVDTKPIVTCGSIIKLRHKSTGTRLHSHKVTYGTGSGQV